MEIMGGLLGGSSGNGSGDGLLNGAASGNGEHNYGIGNETVMMQISPSLLLAYLTFPATRFQALAVHLVNR